MNRPGNMDRLMDRTRHTCRWLLAPALVLLLSDVAAAELPPPCGPFPATADATTVPAGTYQVAYLTLEKGWLAKTGWGYLVPPPMPDEVRARHIAFLGTASGATSDGHVWGHGGLTAWGNRIFIRNNDYLWCVGDPNAKWKPPESYLK